MGAAGCAVRVPGRPPEHLPLLSLLLQRRQRCLPGALSTLMAQSLCRTVCTSL